MSATRALSFQRSTEIHSAPASGRIVGWEPERGIQVELAASGQMVLASSLVEFTAEALERAANERRAVLVTFADGDPERAVILGVVADIPKRATATRSTAPALRGGAASGTPAEEDGVVLVRGRESIELRCGAASNTLRKDGRIVVRGTNVLSRATEEQRIVGGTIHFN
jgi:hypothetical protein